MCQLCLCRYIIDSTRRCRKVFRGSECEGYRKHGYTRCLSPVGPMSPIEEGSQQYCGLHSEPKYRYDGQETFERRWRMENQTESTGAFLRRQGHQKLLPKEAYGVEALTSRMEVGALLGPPILEPTPRHPYTGYNAETLTMEPNMSLGPHTYQPTARHPYTGYDAETLTMGTNTSLGPHTYQPAARHHEPQPGRQYICLEAGCDAVRASTPELQEHVQTHFRRQRRGPDSEPPLPTLGDVPSGYGQPNVEYTCLEAGCDAVRPSTAELAEHVQTHFNTRQPDKKYVCLMPGCDVVRASTPELVKHAQTHFESQTPKPHSGPPLPHLGDVTSGDDQPGTEHPCPVPGCNAVEASTQELRDHIQTHLESQIPEPNSGSPLPPLGDVTSDDDQPETEYPCPVPSCNAIEASTLELRDHIQIHFQNVWSPPSRRGARAPPPPDDAQLAAVLGPDVWEAYSSLLRDDQERVNEPRRRVPSEERDYMRSLLSDGLKKLDEEMPHVGPYRGNREKSAKERRKKQLEEEQGGPTSKGQPAKNKKRKVIPVEQEGKDKKTGDKKTGEGKKKDKRGGK